MDTEHDLRLAIKTFENFVMSGNYAEKIESEKNSKAAKEELKGLLYASDKKRHVFDQYGMVAKFITKEVRKTDHKGLIEEILNYIRSEALSQVISFNEKRLEADGLKGVIEPYQYAPIYYAKPTLNKNGTSYNYTLTEDFKNARVDNLLQAIQFYTRKNNTLENEYKRIMQPFQIMEESKIKTQVGSISKIPKKPIYDIYKMIEEVGEDFVLDYGEVKTTQLEEWIAIGAFPKEIVSAHQQVVDIRLDFIVMTLVAEQRAYNAFQKRRCSFSA